MTLNLTATCARKLKQLREFNNYTQSYVAAYLEISQNAYSLLEKGDTKITLERLEELAKLYKTTLVELITEGMWNYPGSTGADGTQRHSNMPPSVSMLEKKMYEQTISRLESNIEKLYELIAQLSKGLAVPNER